MNNQIKVAIVGYGNLGRGVELSISKNPDMSLVAVFSRRDPKSVTTINTPVFSLENINGFSNAVEFYSDLGKSEFQNVVNRSLNYAIRNSNDFCWLGSRNVFNK